MSRHSDLIVIALRVLSAYNCRQQPRVEDVAEVTRHARPDETDWPIDELACAIVKRQMHRANRAMPNRIQKAS